MKRIIVTGGAGFIGANLVRRLQEEHPSARIVAIDDMRTGAFSNLVDERFGGAPYRGGFIARSLSRIDLPALAERFEPDVIFHLASITDTTVDDEAAMIAENVEPFETLIDIARSRGCRLVWASSAATYGTTANGATAARRPFTLEDAGRPANVYGFSKWVMENLHREAVAAAPDLHIVGLRYFNVFGPGEAHKGKMASMIYQLAQQMIEGRAPRIFRDGDQARDQVDVRDVAGATIAAAAPTASSGIYNVGSGTATSFNQIVSILNDALDLALAPDYFENPFSFYQDYTCADISRTSAGLDWTPIHAPEVAIDEYARWLGETASPSAPALLDPALAATPVPTAAVPAPPATVSR